jgi:hypothetical protein
VCYHDIADIDRVCSTYGTLYRPIGQGIPIMKTHRQNRTLAEKQVDTKNYLLLSEKQLGRAWLSTNQIARGIGMARNGRLKDMLDSMVATGVLFRREVERPGRWPGYEYALSTTTLNFYSRSVTIKARGKAVAQMEMFSNV